MGDPAAALTPEPPFHLACKFNADLLLRLATDLSTRGSVVEFWSDLQGEVMVVVRDGDGGPVTANVMDGKLFVKK